MVSLVRCQLCPYQSANPKNMNCKKIPMREIPIPNYILNEGLHARTMPQTISAAKGSIMIHKIQITDKKFIIEDE
jgi:sulfur transfer complex TusBCD TusB component (DsrH family)